MFQKAVNKNYQKILFTALIIILSLTPLSLSARINKQNTVENKIFKKAKEQGFKKLIIKQGERDSNLKTGFQVKGKLTFSFSFTPSAIYHFRNLKAQNRFNTMQGVADCNGIKIKQNGATFGWRWNKHFRRIEISPLSYVNGKKYSPQNQFGASAVSILESELSDFNPIKFSITAQEDRYLFSIFATLKNGRIIDTNSILPRKCKNKLQIATDKFNFASTGRSPREIIGYYRNESNLFTKNIENIENVAKSVRDLILPD